MHGGIVGGDSHKAGTRRHLTSRSSDDDGTCSE